MFLGVINPIVSITGFDQHTQYFEITISENSSDYMSYVDGVVVTSGVSKSSAVRTAIYDHLKSKYSLAEDYEYYWESETDYNERKNIRSFI